MDAEHADRNRDGVRIRNHYGLAEVWTRDSTGLHYQGFKVPQRQTHVRFAPESKI